MLGPTFTNEVRTEAKSDELFNHSTALFKFCNVCFKPSQETSYL